MWIKEDEISIGLKIFCETMFYSVKNELSIFSERIDERQLVNNKKNVANSK